MALYNGSPVNLSQTIMVSRWLVIPMHRICSLLQLTVSSFSTAFAAHVRTASKICIGSCSTQPSCNSICLISISCEQTSSNIEPGLKIYQNGHKTKYTIEWEKKHTHTHTLVWYLWISGKFAYYDNLWQISFTTKRADFVPSSMTPIKFASSDIFDHVRYKMVKATFPNIRPTMSGIPLDNVTNLKWAVKTNVQ